jgi:hypothetical protein
MCARVHSVEDELRGDGTGGHRDPRLIVAAWSDEICRRG